MVLDHATEDIVSLAEFEERTKLRYGINPVPANVPRSVERLESGEHAMEVVRDGPQKRKANDADEGDEGEMAEKRARL
jgi:hypothetical protein